MEADIAANYETEYEHGADKLSASLSEQIERGRSVKAVDYLKALARIPVVIKLNNIALLVVVLIGAGMTAYEYIESLRKEDE